MRQKINVPSGFPTSAEIVKDLHLKKSDVEAVEAILNRPLVRTVDRSSMGGNFVQKAMRTSPTKQASRKTASRRTTPTRVKAKSIRQMIASRRTKSKRNA